MEFTTGPEDCNVKDFFQRFHTDLPKVVKVTQGFYGEIVEDTFDRDHVLRIETISRQQRVAAVMTKCNYTQHISIPVKYSEKLCVVKHSGKRGREKNLSNILKDNSLPVTVQFPKDHCINVGSRTVSTNHIPHMKLTETFEEIYLLGNFITDGVMCQDIVRVPLYLSKMRIALVTGIAGQPKEKWVGYQEELTRAAGNIVYNKDFGNINIAKYDPSVITSEPIYSFIEPTGYYTFPDIFHHTAAGLSNNQASSAEHITTVDHTTKIPSIQLKSSPVLQAMKMDKDSDSEYCEMPTCYYGRQTQLSSMKPIIFPKPTPAPGPGPGGAPPLPARRETNVCSPISPSGNLEHDYHNNIPFRKINPIPYPEKPENCSPVYRHGKTTRMNVQDVNGPDDVAKLTIEDVGVYLKKLNLEQYVETFKDEMIDGSLLIDLDKDTLKEDFKMKTIEALRLTKFANTGHIPN